MQPIKKVTIENFRQFNELVVNLDEPITSFVGRNGSGKTTIIDAINLATNHFGTEARIKNDDFFNLDEPIKIRLDFGSQHMFFIQIDDGWQKRKIPSETIILTVNHRRSSAGRAFSSPYTISYFIEPLIYDNPGSLGLGGDQQLPAQVIKSSRGTYYYKRRFTDPSEVKLGELQLSNTKNLLNFPAVFHFGQDRDKVLKRGFNSTWTRAINELDWRFLNKYRKEDETNVKQYKSHVNKLTNQINQTTTGSRRRQLIENLINESQSLLGEQFKDLSVTFIDTEHPHQRAELAIQKQDKLITLNNLGSGERTILAILFSKLAAKLSKNKVILLIDEVEEHLHPQLRHALMEYLKKESEQDTQIIYTTHSEALVDLSNGNSVRRLASGEVYPSSATLSKKIEGKELGEHLSDISTYYKDKTILKHEDAQMVFGDCALIVEGPRDKYCLPIAADTLERSLSRIPTIISANGKTNIPHYQVICEVFGIKYFVVYDEDQHEDDESNKRIESLAGDNFFRFSPSFESVVQTRNMTQISQDFKDPKKIPDQVVKCINAIEQWIITL